MKYLMVVPVLDNYGASQTAIAVCEQFLQNGFEVVVWCPIGHHKNEVTEKMIKSWDGKFSVQELDLPILRRLDLYSFKIFQILYLHLFKIFRMRKYLLKNFSEFQIIHFATLSTILCAFLPKKERVLTFSVHEIPRNLVERFVCSVIIKWRCDAVIACSKYIADYFPSLRVKVIYSGANIDRFVSTYREIEYLHKPLKILCIGRFNQWKGQDILLEAVRMVNRDQILVDVSFAGSPFPGQEYILRELSQTVEDNKLDNMFHFLGEISGIEQIISNFDVLCVPSKLPEPFGKVVIEGLAAGRILIASNKGGPAEIIEHQLNGILFRINDVSDLASKIEWILEHEIPAKELAKRGALRALEFSERECGKSYYNLMTKLTN